MAKQDNPENNAEEQKVEIPEVQHELSKVATNPKQSILILVIICGICGYLAFNLFLGNKKAVKDTPAEVPDQITKPVETATSEVPSIPQLPDPPKLEEPELPVVPELPKVNDTKTEAKDTPPFPAATDNNPINQNPVNNNDSNTGLPIKFSDSDETQKRKAAKRKAAIVLVAGVPEKKTAEEIEQEADFKKRGNMELVLGRGKIIDAVLESAINTDFGGEVRAVISRDIFSESGRVILIPKGSRVFGDYGTNIEGAYGRISVAWNRIDLASGYTINLQGTGIDNLGRKGTQGRVDNKFKERLANVILMSAFNIGVAKGLDKLVPPPPSSQAATSQTQAATNIQNIITAATTTPSGSTPLTPQAQIAQICAGSLAAIPDSTSAAYTAVQAACVAAQSPTAGTPAQALAGLQAAINSALTTLITEAATTTTPTQSQAASTQAFTDITDTMKDMINQNQFKPTITINQGTPIKIYVNKDYKFPKAAISKSRLMP